MPQKPEPPERVAPTDWQHYELWLGVRRALLHERQVRDDAGEIRSPSGVAPYPASKSNIADQPTRDGGNNFGRLARYGLMDNYIAQMQSALVRGIEVHDWQTFFKAHLS